MPLIALMPLTVSLLCSPHTTWCVRRWFAQTGRKPLFPFGYGLSYTQFRYGKYYVATLGKIAIGVMHQRVDVNGLSILRQPLAPQVGPAAHGLAVRQRRPVDGVPAESPA